MTDYKTIADDTAIETAKTALEANNFKVTVVADAAMAKETVLAILPKGAEVFTVTSETLRATGIATAINESGDYDAVLPKLMTLMGDPTKKQEQRKLGAAPEYVVGSVHALTQDGHALIASNTGSQLPAYAYGAGHVVWVVGAQKIVTDLADAEQRLSQHVVPLEDVRSQAAYGSHTAVNKKLVFNKEGAEGRIEIVIVKEALGF
jgi:L-lactate utilization protein LutC